MLPSLYTAAETNLRDEGERGKERDRRGRGGGGEGVGVTERDESVSVMFTYKEVTKIIYFSISTDC